jgi:ribonuclease BN (tRNA processing enzyme)
MKIEILGCSGSVWKGFNTTSILINGDTLIDAGSAASVLGDEALLKIKHILLTHSHIDHIKELPFILDVLYCNNARGVNIWGSKPTMDVLKAHLFNGLIWPEIEELKMDAAIFRFESVPLGWFGLGKAKIMAIEVEHITGSVAYLVSEAGRHVLFSGDTGYTQDLFDLAASLGDSLKAFFIEASFPNRMHEVAEVSLHMTPNLIEKGTNGLVSGSPRVIAYHIKPRYLDEVIAELPEGVEYIRGGEVFTL